MKEKRVTLERVHLGISVIVRLILLIAVISSTVKEEWILVFVGVCAFFLTFLPAIIEKNLKIYLPTEIEIIIIIFVYSSMFLGNIHNYYTRFWWWDILLHASASLCLGFIGFAILFTLYEKKVVLASPWTILFFSFCFALALGAMWEIYEYSMDILFHTSMQLSLKDTMTDLIVDGGAAFTSSVIGYLYLKGGRTSIIDNLISAWIKKNPPPLRK